MKFAAFSGVFAAHSMQEAMLLTKQLGFDGIEIAARGNHITPDTSPERITEIKQLAQTLQLDIPALAGYMGGFSTASDKECAIAIDEFKRLLDIASELGASMIRVQPGGPNAFMAQDYHYTKAAYWLNLCGVEARAKGIQIVLEIHNESLVETVPSALKLLSMIEQDNIGLIHDAGNMYITDTDYGRESVLQLGKHLAHVHVKDEKRVAELGAPGTFRSLTHRGNEAFLQSRLGEGEADHQPLFDALREIGYSGWLTLECHAPFPAVERLAYDLHVVKNMLA
ncbi:xylose isomerase [Paenibacillus pectinilyticus]|uniref:Xylose isomerase n=1 Tax=Paenibacillus pectinilyticus TaxID=512399 RepID=A0A1C1A4T0_9BACL|nr:sugar phosphate isomerase/epimerase family protein [Paenibacillus pectinilyticus]OCT15571.1 xylose isomerase [Paenibacillus pectinilyticus]